MLHKCSVVLNLNWKYHYELVLYFTLNDTLSDFPGGPVVKNLPANAGNNFHPWSRKIPHATGQLSPATTEPLP